MEAVKLFDKKKVLWIGNMTERRTLSILALESLAPPLD
jgi:hypothetical protein